MEKLSIESVNPLDLAILLIVTFCDLTYCDLTSGEPRFYFKKAISEG